MCLFSFFLVDWKEWRWGSHFGLLASESLELLLNYSLILLKGERLWSHVNGNDFGFFFSRSANLN